MLGGEAAARPPASPRAGRAGRRAPGRARMHSIMSSSPKNRDLLIMKKKDAASAFTKAAVLGISDQGTLRRYKHPNTVLSLTVGLRALYHQCGGLGNQEVLIFHSPTPIHLNSVASASTI